MSPLFLYTIKYHHSTTYPQFDFIKVLDFLKDNRQMEYDCLCLQIEFDAANFDDRSGY